MSIPALDEHGFLPEGIHDCPAAEIEERFGRFQRTDQRCRLFRRFEEFLRDVTVTGFFQAVIVDGSFVTGADDPHDIDVILVLRRGHNFAAEVRPFEYNVLSRREVRRQYGFDMALVVEDSEDLEDAVGFQPGPSSTRAAERNGPGEVMIQNDAEYRQSLEQMDRMYRILGRLHAEVLPQSTTWYKLMAEGPIDEIRKLQREIDGYLGLEEHAATARTD